MSNFKKGICILKCEENHIHGKINFKEQKDFVKVKIYVENISEGNHGIHIHKLGNEEQSPTSLCEHFNPEKTEHGDLNEKNSHAGDLGNIKVKRFEKNGKIFYIGKRKLYATKFRLSGNNSVYGRSVIVHEDEDDLGRGNFNDSKTTGHSGRRILWGIIGMDEDHKCL
jgi:superoxide dismutase, Cu-Zn family